jgi:hypothetical protein
MKFYARCSQHSCNLLIRSHLPGLHWRLEEGYYEVKLDGFECPTAKEMGQDGLYVGLAGTQYICRHTWVLEPIDDTVAKPAQILVDAEELSGIARQLRGIASRLGEIVNRFRKEVST